MRERPHDTSPLTWQAFEEAADAAQARCPEGLALSRMERPSVRDALAWADQGLDEATTVASLQKGLMHITGHCHCGHISFTALVDPSRVIACHCEDCQRFSGGPFRAVLPTPADQVQMTGSPRHYVKVADSGNRRAQAFCGECGTQLYACEPENPTVLNIRLGCVDQRAELPPQVQIWGHSAMPWLAGLSEVPLHERGSGSAPAAYPGRQPP